MGFVYYTMKQALAKGLNPNAAQQKYWKGLWYNTKTKKIVLGGNRIKNSDGSYVQLNSDGTITKLYDGKNFTKEGTKLLRSPDQISIKAGQVFDTGKFRKDTSDSDDKYFDNYRKALDDYIINYMDKSTTATDKLNMFLPSEVLGSIRESGEKDDETLYKEFLESIIQHNNKHCQQGSFRAALGMNDDQAPEGYYDGLRAAGLVYKTGGKLQYFR